ncbi:unnamed protein product [Discosporangium mesarthrocarpum]
MPIIAGAGAGVVAGETSCLLGLPSANVGPSLFVDTIPNLDKETDQPLAPAERCSNQTRLSSRGHLPDRHRTKFASLTPAPGSFRAAGEAGSGKRAGEGNGMDTRASEVVTLAKRTWAQPALRTKAVASYGAIPDLEVIPEDTAIRRFHIRERVRHYAQVGCPSCTVS